uniref:BHLH domain-containing protein n=1 Tax=Oryza meridionalis TaxID=40149 RepID=A0A0E0EIN4_9ORYZ
MADHQEMIHAAAAPAMYGGGGGGAAGGATTTTGSHGGGGDWWSAAVSSCSAPAPETMQGFGGWSAAVVAVDGGGNTSRSAAGNTASSESPGSLATGSSITFQEPAGGGGGVADPAAIAVHAQTVAGGGWNQQPFLDGSGFHGYMSSSRNDHHTNHHHHHHIKTPSLMSHSSSNNSVMLQDHHHDQNYQFLSNLGFELLSSPTSPYGGSGGGGGFRSSLLRSLTEPPAAAVAKPNNSPGFQQYHNHQHQPAMNLQPPAAAGREPLQFTNSTAAPFWNPSSGFTVAADGAALGGAGASPAQTTPASLAAKRALEGVGDSSSIITKKAKADSTPLKKSRTGTPSPLPTTFKACVRKEKLGDRVTALQQLVSPFGKTDTASVLHETIEYIKFLHDQVGALSAPYLKNRQQVLHLKNSAGVDNDGGGGGEATAASKRDLTGRGLCLVPISSTFAVASETPVDFWTPFGAAFR